MDLWGFTDRRFSVPSKEKIKNVLSITGFDKIILHPEDNVVKFMFSGMKLDLGAIAKGYALDRAVKKLKENNIHSCLINAGGQVYCLGERLGEPWKIAIKDPRSQDVGGPLKLKNQSVATSGDYEQYFMHRNKRYAHILNPKTGYPVDSGVVSVTVIAPDGLTADALSTSIFVLGKEKGLKLAQQFQDVQVKVIEGKDVSHNP
jgi:thiamine biosynthesis lipoprotein